MHPQLLSESDFIRERSRLAEEVYQTELRSGSRFETALELAQANLYEGLHFSQYRMVYDILCEDFEEIPSEKRVSAALYLLPRCTDIMQKYSLPDYPLSDENSYQFKLEVTGIIQIYIEENDI